MLPAVIEIVDFSCTVPEYVPGVTVRVSKLKSEPDPRTLLPVVAVFPYKAP